MEPLPLIEFFQLDCRNNFYIVVMLLVTDNITSIQIETRLADYRQSRLYVWCRVYNAYRDRF